MSSSLYLQQIGATPEERRLVQAAVRAVFRFEQDMQRRILAGRQGRDVGKPSAEPREFPSAESILIEAGVDWRRQVSLLVATLLLAKERGLQMNYSAASTWRKSLVRQRA